MNVQQPMPDDFENRLANAARHFPYPPARIPHGLFRPRRAPAARRPVLVIAAVLLLALLSLFSVPSVRAAVVEFFQVGVLRIFFGGPEPLPESRLPFLRELSGRVTLEDAAANAGIPVRYPEVLGEPDEVYIQTIEGPLVLMVWFEGSEPSATLLALGPGAFAGKNAPQAGEETRVGGRPAYWLAGPHLLYLQLADGSFDAFEIFEAGSTLVWTVGEVTYRLEGPADRDTAIRIAESLKGTGTP